MNTYVGGDIDVYKETIEHDRLSFLVVEGIAKSYGYKSGDLIYYLLSGSTVRNGLKLITSNFDVHEMVQAHSGLPIIELYINSFSESIPDIGEENSDDDNGDDEGGYCRIEGDDLYWDEVDEPDLFVENNDVPGPSRGGGTIEMLGSIEMMGTIEMLATSVGRVGKIVGKIVMVMRVKRVARMKSPKRVVMTVVGQQLMMMMMPTQTWHPVTFLHLLQRVMRSTR